MALNDLDRAWRDLRGQPESREKWEAVVRLVWKLRQGPERRMQEEAVTQHALSELIPFDEMDQAIERALAG
jgi:hypothetical protein